MTTFYGTSAYIHAQVYQRDLCHTPSIYIFPFNLCFSFPEGCLSDKRFYSRISTAEECWKGSAVFYNCLKVLIFIEHKHNMQKPNESCLPASTASSDEKEFQVLGRCNPFSWQVSANLLTAAHGIVCSLSTVTYRADSFTKVFLGCS